MSPMHPDVAVRFLESDDAPEVEAAASDPKLAATCNIPDPYPGASEFMEKVQAEREAGTRYTFAIERNGNFAGMVALHRVNKDEGTAQLEFWVSVPYWGQGIATAAARIVISWAFRELGLQKIYGCTFMDIHPAGARVLEKCGFVDEEETINDGQWGNKFVGEKVTVATLTREAWDHEREVSRARIEGQSEFI